MNYNCTKTDNADGSFVLNCVPSTPVPPDPPVPPQPPSGDGFDPTQPDKVFKFSAPETFNSYPLPAGKTYWQLGLAPGVGFPACYVRMSIPGATTSNPEYPNGVIITTSGFTDLRLGGPFDFDKWVLPPSWTVVCEAFAQDPRVQPNPIPISAPLQIQCVPQ